MYDTFIQFLNRLLNKPLSKAAQAQISRSFKLLTIPKNAKLLEQGQVCHHWYYILKGCCRYYHIKNQQEFTHWFSFEHEIATSLISFTSQKPSYEAIVILEDSQMLAVERTRLYYLFDHYHEWERIGRLLLQEMTARLEHRIITYYALTAKEKYMYILEKEPHIIQRVPMKYISSFLGVTQETLSRIRADIQ